MINCHEAAYLMPVQRPGGIIPTGRPQHDSGYCPPLPTTICAVIGALVFGDVAVSVATTDTV